MDLKKQKENLVKLIQEKQNELEKLIKQKDELTCQIYYQEKGIPFGKPFLYKGKVIVKIKPYSLYHIKGWYLTKTNEISKTQVIIRLEDEVEAITE